MNKQKGLAPILIIILIAVAVGGYLIYRNYSNNQTKPTTVPQQSIQPSPTVDETANWKTYTNTEWGFTLKYPQDWSEGKPDRENHKDANYPTFKINFGTLLTKNHIGQTVTPYVSEVLDVSVWDIKNEGISIKEAAEKFPYYCSGFYDKGINKQIWGYQAMVFESTPCGIVGSQIAYIMAGRKFYQIINNSSNNSENILDQILSTFKFLDQTTPVTEACVNKKTYRSLEDALEEPSKVCYLDLSRRNLIELPKEVLQFANLQDLYLNFNKLTTLPEDIKNLKNLTSIDLTGNPITTEETNRIRSLLPKVNIFNIQPMNLPQ